MRRMPLILLAALALALIAAGCGDDDGGDTTVAEDLTLTSSAFEDGDELAVKYTCDGEGVSPPLAFDGIPPETVELILVLRDTDAPGGTFIHATAYGIDPANVKVEEDATPPASLIGQNDGDVGGYAPPCPPEGDGPHSYEFVLFALNDASGLEAGADTADVLDAADEFGIATATLTATYER